MFSVSLTSDMRDALNVLLSGVFILGLNYVVYTMTAELAASRTVGEVVFAGITVIGVSIVFIGAGFFAVELFPYVRGAVESVVE